MRLFDDKNNSNEIYTYIRIMKFVVIVIINFLCFFMIILETKVKNKNDMLKKNSEHI